MKYIYIKDDYRIKRLDKYNWGIQRFRASGKDDDGEPKWFDCNRFYQTLASSMIAAYEMMLSEGDECLDLDHAIARCVEIKSEITRVAREVAANAS